MLVSILTFLIIFRSKIAHENYNNLIVRKERFRGGLKVINKVPEMSEFLTRFSSISDLRKGDPFNSLSAPFRLSKIRCCMQ
jgi:hypothetical protein